MKTRILSAVVALPLLLFIVISGGIWLHVGVGLLGLIGMYEFNRAIAGEVKGAHIIAYLFGLFYVVFMDKLVYTQTLFSVFTSLFVLALLIYSVLCYRKTSYVECCASFFGFFYACFLLSHVYLVREFDDGKLLIWLAFISAFGSKKCKSIRFQKSSSGIFFTFRNFTNKKPQHPGTVSLQPTISKLLRLFGAGEGNRTLVFSLGS